MAETYSARTLVMLYRQHTACRQYVMRTPSDLEKFVKRHPYRNESLTVMLAFDSRCVGMDALGAAKPPPPPVPHDWTYSKAILPAANVVEYVTCMDAALCRRYPPDHPE